MYQIAKSTKIEKVLKYKKYQNTKSTKIQKLFKYILLKVQPTLIPRMLV